MNTKTCVALWAFVAALLATGCAASTATPQPAPTNTPAPAITLPGGYRPLQHGDVVEGATIDYQYILPSLEKPAVVVAFGEKMLNLVQINPDLSDGFVAYAQEVLAQTGSVLAFDEAAPAQTTPKAVTFDKSKPVELAFIPLTEEQHYWSVSESSDGEVRTAYKIVRRRDGGLRLVDAYDIVVLQSLANIITRWGNGTGLGFSARVAQLRSILNDPGYQFGVNAMQNRPPDTSQYDPRVLRLDPSKSGLNQNIEWIMISRSAPSPGIPTGN